MATVDVGPDPDPREIFPLHEVLRTLPCPPGYTADDVSKKWRCRICPMPLTEASMLRYFQLGVPCFGPPEASSRVHQECNGSAIDFITDPRWGMFPAPKVAFHAGWAGPGTQFGAEDLHTMINAFSDVIASGSEGQPVLNLQYFHRNDPEKDPPIPALAKHLVWPSYLTEAQGGVVCDTATRVSKRGAVTWWHLDDSGEFVMQTGLPPTPDQVQHCSVHSPFVTLSPIEQQKKHFTKHPYGTLPLATSRYNKVPVKLFIYSPPDSYDWMMHDRETDDNGKIAALHLFKIKDEHLPPAGYLPILNVAVLVAGGPPLVSPPNIPHMVISVNDCVMVEQRRVGNFFLDEIAYFMQKTKQWAEPPIIYYYLRVSLKDAGHVQCLVVKPLLARMRELAAQSKELQTYIESRTNPSQNGEVLDPEIEDSLPVQLAQRILASLIAVATFPDYFSMTDKDRAALVKELDDGSTAIGHFYEISAPFVKHLRAHWDVERHWAEPATIFRLNRTMSCAVVYDSNGSPIYGPPRPTVAQAKADHANLTAQQDYFGEDKKAPVKIEKVAAVAHDAVLDELF